MGRSVSGQRQSLTCPDAPNGEMGARPTVEEGDFHQRWERSWCFPGGGVHPTESKQVVVIFKGPCSRDLPSSRAGWL